MTHRFPARNAKNIKIMENLRPIEVYLKVFERRFIFKFLNFKFLIVKKLKDESNSVANK